MEKTKVNLMAKNQILEQLEHSIDNGEMPCILINSKIDYLNSNENGVALKKEFSLMSQAPNDKIISILEFMLSELRKQELRKN